MRKNIILCGVGGQGIVLTSKLLAASAMAKGIPVMSAETIGMAQKGGSVFSFLRMGDDLCCPMFPKGTADLLIGFEPAEAVRMLPYLKPDGTVILNTHPIQPVTATLGGGAYDAAEMIGYVQRNAGNVDAAGRRCRLPGDRLAEGAEYGDAGGCAAQRCAAADIGRSDGNHGTYCKTAVPGIEPESTAYTRIRGKHNED